jgi:hypothetical protein
MERGTEIFYNACQYTATPTSATTASAVLVRAAVQRQWSMRPSGWLSGGGRKFWSGEVGVTRGSMARHRDQAHGMVSIIEAVAEDMEIAVWGPGLCAAEPSPHRSTKIPPARSEVGLRVLRLELKPQGELPNARSSVVATAVAGNLAEAFAI